MSVSIETDAFFAYIVLTKKSMCIDCLSKKKLKSSFPSMTYLSLFGFSENSNIIY